MHKKKNSLLSLLLAGGSLLVASCAPLHPDLPLNYSDAIITVKDANGKEITVYMNTYKQLYEGLGDVSEFAVNRILDTIASQLSQGQVKDHLDDNKVMNLYSSKVGDMGSKMDLAYITGIADNGESFTSDTLSYANLTNELQDRAQKALLDRVNADDGSFDGRGNARESKYLFNEQRFVRSLEQDNLMEIGADKVVGNLDKVVNKTSTFEQVFTPGIYDSFMNNYSYWTPIEQKLTAQYIYNERYSNIANAVFRNISVVALKDPDNSSRPAASNLIRTYKNEYLLKGQTIDPAFAADPLGELSLLWKGIGGYARRNLEGDLGNLPTRYEDFLTADQKAFLNDNRLSNLYDGVQDDIYRINKHDSSATDLENEYTENNALTVKAGRIKKLDSIVKQNVLTKGIFRKTDLSSVPSKVTDRIYASNHDEVLSKEGTFGDHRYITSPDNTGEENDIDIYDSASSTHYVVMMDNDGIYNRNYLGDKDKNENDEEKRSAAMDVAYNMIDSSTYKKDATVYWIKKFVGDGEFKVNNKSFYDYLEKEYPDLFDDNVKY